MIHGVAYDAFTGRTEQEIECESCGRYYAVEFDWNGDSWEPRHHVQADADGFHCNTIVYRDKSEWRKCVFCDHVNAVEASSDVDEPLLFPKLPTPQTVCAVCHGDDDACVACDGTGSYGSGLAVQRGASARSRSPFERYVHTVNEAYGRAYREGVL